MENLYITQINAINVDKLLITDCAKNLFFSSNNIQAQNLYKAILYNVSVWKQKTSSRIQF